MDFSIPTAPTDWSADVFDGVSGSEAITTVTSLGADGAALADVTPAGYSTEVGEPQSPALSDPISPAKSRPTTFSSGHHQLRPVVVIVAMLAALGYLVHVSSSSARTTSAVAPETSALVSHELSSAASFLHAHGVLTGWPRPPGALVASTMGELVLAQRVGGVCYYGGVLPNTTTAVHVDSSGASCTPAAITAAQQGLSSDQAEAIAQAKTSLDAAGREAQLLAAGYASGVTSPVFGIQPDPPVTGVTTLSVTPSSMVLRDGVSTGGCLTVVIPVVGPIPTPESGPCSP